MSHPTDQFADYVDDRLAPEVRAEVDAHLASCATCREEIERARTARAALAKLPELAAPLGIAEPVTEQAETETRDAQRGAARREPRTARVYQIVAGVVAAALVGVFAISLVSQRGGDTAATDSLSAASGAGAPAAEAALPAPIASASPAPADAPGGRDTDGDYTGEELQALADRAVDQAKHGKRTEVFAPLTPTSGDAVAGSAGDQSSNSYVAGAERTAVAVEKADAHAVACLRKAGAFESGGALQQVFEAKLVGHPSYFGIVLTGAEPGDAADRIVVWVAAKHGCDVLGFAQSYIVRPSPSPFPEELSGITPPPGFDPNSPPPGVQTKPAKT